jgi:hypothetical protein
VKPYQQLQAMQESLQDREPTAEEKRRALALLQKIFDTKQVPAEEQAHKLRRLAIDTEETEIL